MLASVRGHFPKGPEMISALAITAFTVAVLTTQVLAIAYVLTAEPPSDAELDALEAGGLK
ncbi:hypothetical protein D8M36_04225 [Dermabacter sp. HSID17554]|nr:hypothetical protein D8M36_04225 [Dermabacter sp. HSID17554]